MRMGAVGDMARRVLGNPVFPMAGTPVSVGPFVASVAVALALMHVQPADAGGAISIDRSFGGDGRVLTGFGREAVFSFDADLGLQSGNRPVLLEPTGPGYSLARYLSDGEVDRSFGEDGYVSGSFGLPRLRGYAADLVVQPDDKLVVAGEIVSRRDDLRGKIAFARYNADGSIDRSFGKHGVAVSKEIALWSNVDGLALQDDGKVVAMGTARFNTVLVRVDADGTLDSSFGTAGVVRVRFGEATNNSDIATQGTKILVAGHRMSGGGILRLNANGSVDQGFGGGDGVATVPADTAAALAVQPDGRIVVAAPYGRVFRYLPDGTLDPSFGDQGTARLGTPGALPETASARAVAIRADGSIVVTGPTNTSGLPHPRDFMLARLTPAGQADSTFGNGTGLVTTDIADGSTDESHLLAVLSDGTVIVGGETEPPSRAGFLQSEIALVRYEQDGQLHSAFGRGAGILRVRAVVPSFDVVKDVALEPDGGVLAVGRGAGQVALARYIQNGRLDRAFGRGGRVTIRTSSSPLGEQGESVATLPSGDIVVGSGSFTGAALLRFQRDGRLDVGFGNRGIVALEFIRHIAGVKVLKGGKLLVAGLDRYRSFIARFHGNGVLDKSFGDGDGVVEGPTASPSGGGTAPLSVAIQPDGQIVLAGGRYGGFVARFTAAGEPDRSFGGGGTVELGRVHIGRPEGIATASGKVVVVGTRKGSFRVARLTAAGQPDQRFGRHGVVETDLGEPATATDIAVQRNGRITVVGSVEPDCSKRICRDVPFSLMALVRYNRDGSLDFSFGRHGILAKRAGVDAAINTIALGRRGSIVVGGAATALGQWAQFLLTRFKSS